MPGLQEHRSSLISSGLPSPTLTNPDMILPYGDTSRASTPSPRLKTMNIPSPLQLGALTSHPPFATFATPPGVKHDTNIDLTPPSVSGSSTETARDGESGSTPRGDAQSLAWNATRINSSSAASSSAGPQLLPAFDTESNSFPGSGHTASRTIDLNYRHPVHGEHSGVINAQTWWKRQTSQETNPDMEQFEHEVSTVDGDDDEEGDEENDQYSHAALSRKAERILANAKRRLDTMEGNLYRARSSLLISPSSSMSSKSSNSPYKAKQMRHSPSPNDIFPSLGKTPAKHRELHLAETTNNGSPGHARISSETSVPSSLHTSPQVSHRNRLGIRASSVLDTRSRTSLLDAQQSRHRPGFNSESRSMNRHQDAHTPRFSTNFSTLSRGTPFANNLYLQPLQEDQASSRISTSSQSLFSDGFPIDPAQESLRSGLTRSRSSMQMREIRDQMNDLRSKVSTLKQKAKEDGMRRRSLQSLRTPSPFTAAEMWYHGALEYAPGALSRSVGPELPVSKTSQRTVDKQPVDPEQSLNGDVLPSIDEAVDRSAEITTTANEQRNVPYLGVEKVGNGQISDPGIGNVFDPVEETSAEIRETDSPRAPLVEEEDDTSETGESIYHEVSTDPPSGERHEDRVDAFDYEHSFLHSGMGHFSRSHPTRRDSYSSTGSVETIQGFVPTPAIPDKDQGSSHATGLQQPRHQRNDSVQSVSTTATFATAQEDKPWEDSSEDGDYDCSEYMRPMIPQQGAAAENLPSLIRYPTPTNSRPPSRGKGTDGDPFQKPPTPAWGSSPPSAPRQRRRPISLMLSTLVEPGSSPQVRLEGDDEALVEQLLRSLAKACVELPAHSTAYEGRIWRRRLDAARRVLEGEESF